MGSRQPESGQVVIEPCIQPSGRFMAAGAIGREIAGSVIRIRGALKILHVAAVAVCWCAGVSSGDVALATGLCRVGSRQREFRGRVIEFCARPGVHVVAILAIVTEAGLRMARVFGPVEILHMTAEAVL